MIPEEYDYQKFKGNYVVVKTSGDKYKNLEDALNKLKRLIKDDKLFIELQNHSGYRKPSEIKRDIKNRAKARNISNGKT